MSATKNYIDANCYYNKSSNKFNFIDGYEESAPTHIMQRRFKNAGINNEQKIFKYDCDDLEKHKFYQALYQNRTLLIDVQWYNTYLEMVNPANCLCVVNWIEDGNIEEVLADFVVEINQDKIAFWFNENSKSYHCRKGIEYII